MTILIGSNDTTGFTNTPGGECGGDKLFNIWEQAAVATGNVAKLYLYMSSFDTATGIKLCLHDSSGTLLGATAAITTGYPGWVSGTITPVSVTQGQNYYLSFLVNGYITPFCGPNAWSAAFVAMSYTTPDAFVTTNLASISLADFRMYAETAAGGGDVSLALPSTGGATAGTAARGTQTPNLSVPL